MSTDLPASMSGLTFPLAKVNKQEQMAMKIIFYAFRNIAILKPSLLELSLSLIKQLWPRLLDFNYFI